MRAPDRQEERTSVATPAMCTVTERSFSQATRRTDTRFRRPWLDEDDERPRMAVPRRETERRRELLRAPQVDRRDDGDLPDEVHHRDQPAPARSAEERGPVVHRARGRERARELGHGERDEERARAHQRPARPRPAGRRRERDVVGRDDARQHADDREAQREAREAAHRRNSSCA